QAEDGIRYLTVTGVQTCALPISADPVWFNSFIPGNRQSDRQTKCRARGGACVCKQSSRTGYSLSPRDSRKQRIRWLSLGNGAKEEIAAARIRSNERVSRVAQVFTLKA